MPATYGQVFSELLGQGRSEEEILVDRGRATGGQVASALVVMAGYLVNQPGCKAGGCGGRLGDEHLAKLLEWLCRWRRGLLPRGHDSGADQRAGGQGGEVLGHEGRHQWLPLRNDSGEGRRAGGRDSGDDHRAGGREGDVAGHEGRRPRMVWVWMECLLGTTPVMTRASLETRRKDTQAARARSLGRQAGTALGEARTSLPFRRQSWCSCGRVG